MKKRFFSLMVILFVAISSFSQVQNKFFGATLGHSDANATYSSMYNYFGEKPSIPLGLDYGMAIGNKNYAGYRWDAIIAYFYNGKFSNVRLRYHNDWKASSQTIQNVFENLKKELKAKYGGKTSIMYKNILQNYEEGFLYFDGRYGVKLIMKGDIKKKNYTEVYLEYWDNKLIQQPKHPIINDDL